MDIFELSLRHIVVFNSVAETLNMSKSAKKLFITQPAISQTIKDIENKFGVKLFVRNGKNLKLTEEGKELYIYTKRVINLLKEAQLCLENFNTLNKGCVKIGASTTIGNYLLPEVIKAFKLKYPNIDITVFIENTEQVLRKLKLCDIGVGLIEGLPNVDDKRIRLSKFIKDEIVFFCSPKNRLANKSEVSVKELEGEIFINREVGSGTRQIIEREIRKFGVTLNIDYELNNSEAIKNAVMCNLGVSALSKLIVKREIENGNLKIINVKDIKIYRWFYLLEIGSYNKAQKIFVDHLKSLESIPPHILCKS